MLASQNQLPLAAALSVVLTLTSCTKTATQGTEASSVRTASAEGPVQGDSKEETAGVNEPADVAGAFLVDCVKKDDDESAKGQTTVKCVVTDHGNKVKENLKDLEVNYTTKSGETLPEDNVEIPPGDSAYSFICVLTKEQEKECKGLEVTASIGGKKMTLSTSFAPEESEESHEESHEEKH